MEVSFLLDENVAVPLADKLDKAGHDVERVVDEVFTQYGLDGVENQRVDLGEWYAWLHE